MGLKALAVFIDNADSHIAAHDDKGACGVFDEIGIFIDDFTLIGALHDGFIGHRSCTADVEGPHGELRSRLANGLGGNNADRFAHIDLSPARQITAIAGRANAVAGFAGKR